MQDVPKIVQERLRAAAPAVDHPDADLLTAFTEQSLAGAERAVVLEHLARCGDCRDIVALSLPAAEPVATAVKTSSGGWFAWPVLRWGFVTAGVIAIATLGVVRYQRRPATAASQSISHFEVAANEANKPPLAAPSAAGAAKKADKIQSPSAPAFADATDAKNAIVYDTAPTLHAEAKAAVVVPQVSQGTFGRSGGLTVGGPVTHGPKMAEQWQQQRAAQQAQTPTAPSRFAKQQAAGDLTRNMRVPAVSETVAVEARAAELDTQQKQDEPQIGERETTSEAKDKAAAPPAAGDYALARVGKAKPAESSPSVSGPSTPAPYQATERAMFVLSPPVSRWTITSTGGLQRSVDQGNSWQDVNVIANLPASTSIEISAHTSRVNADKKKLKEEKKDRTRTVTFRAVSANGPDVWAGGSALYHSMDSGSHWNRVVPASAGAIITGEIVSLEFPDVQHGKVSTSTAEVWTTSDSGQTWQKQ